MYDGVRRRYCQWRNYCTVRVHSVLIVKDTLQGVGACTIVVSDSMLSLVCEKEKFSVVLDTTYDMNEMVV